MALSRVTPLGLAAVSIYDCVGTDPLSIALVKKSVREGGRDLGLTDSCCCYVAGRDQV